MFCLRWKKILHLNLWQFRKNHFVPSSPLFSSLIFFCIYFRVCRKVVRFFSEWDEKRADSLTNLLLFPLMLRSQWEMGNRRPRERKNEYYWFESRKWCFLAFRSFKLIYFAFMLAFELSWLYRKSFRSWFTYFSI